MMFSILSQGYGTYDGTAKKDVQEIPDQKVYRTDQQIEPTNRKIAECVSSCCHLSYSCM